MKSINTDSSTVRLKDLNLPEDIKKLSYADLVKLSPQIRSILIKSVSKTGGHLASNLGTVELTLALYKIFDAPKDKIIWDVGHQSYTHKILTGRLNSFSTLRQENGISGFTKPTESEYDAFISGHSSTSISAALGFATVMKNNKDNHYAIAVIGDGALTGGLAYEGLNNAGKSDTNLIVILNHNEMSISKNVGALSKYLSTMRTTQSYQKTKNIIEKTLNKTPLVGKPIKTLIKSQKNTIKEMLLHSTMFEDFGFEFIGPVDGHNIHDLCEAFNNARAMHRPVFIHVNTYKGKGYAPAELNPGRYHAVSRFEIATGNPDVVESDSYSSEWGKELSRLADSDDRIFAITAAMKYGTGLQYFKPKHINRFYDVGIAEQHAVTFSAALSKMGCIPVFCVYSSFLQRAYDQILHDASIDNSHIVLGIDRAGIIGEDGETHQGLFDVPFLTTIPNVTIYSPYGYDEMRLCLNNALYKDTGIVGVRYPKGAQNNQIMNIYPCTDYYHFNNNSDILIISYGRLSLNIINAKNMLSMDNINCDVLKLTKIFPIDIEIINIIKKYKHIFFFEESMQNGSISEKLGFMLCSSDFKGKYFSKAITQYVKQATVENALINVGFDSNSIINTIKQELNQWQ